MTEQMEDNDVAVNLAAVKSRIRAAIDDGENPSATPAVIAVSKHQPVGRIELALRAGHRLFGENRVQEAQEKWPALKARYPDTELHLIGGLQTNKVEDALALFDVIQTLDRPKLAERLAAAMAKTGRGPRLFIQVNTGEEPQKSGVAPADLPALLALCREKLGLSIAGLMCIPPADDAPQRHFTLLRDLADRNGVEKLSMGMSNDYEIAARQGADYVRVGTAIFGGRG